MFYIIKLDISQRVFRILAYLQILENSSRNSLKFLFSGSHRPFYWKTHPVFFRNLNSGASHRPFYWKTHPFEFRLEPYSLYVIGYVIFGQVEVEVFSALERDLKNGLDEFSSKTACVTPQN